jgi:hypothetical protein
VVAVICLLFMLVPRNLKSIVLTSLNVESFDVSPIIVSKVHNIKTIQHNFKYMIADYVPKYVYGL